MNCRDSKEQGIRNIEKVASEESFVKPNIKDTSLVYESGRFQSLVRIEMPETEFRGTILVLQGWNFPNTSWSDSSNLELLASESGFALVMPEMGKSIYHKRNYPQTRKDWKRYPTRTWLVDTVIADLQTRYKLFLPEQNNFVMGLSTGGRGAFIIAQENSGIFSGGASLSGDYDQSAFPGDNLYRGFFGTNPAGWSEDENPMSFVKSWSVPMYFAHGESDSVVSVKHQLILEEIKKEHNNAPGWIFRIEEDAGHDYHFWGQQVESIINFFLRILER